MCASSMGLVFQLSNPPARCFRRSLAPTCVCIFRLRSGLSSFTRNLEHPQGKYREASEKIRPVILGKLGAGHPLRNLLENSWCLIWQSQLHRLVSERSTYKTEEHLSASFVFFLNTLWYGLNKCVVYANNVFLSVQSSILILQNFDIAGMETNSWRKYSPVLPRYCCPCFKGKQEVWESHISDAILP